MTIYLTLLINERDQTRGGGRGCEGGGAREGGGGENVEWVRFVNNRMEGWQEEVKRKINQNNRSSVRGLFVEQDCPPLAKINGLGSHKRVGKMG